MSLGNLDRRRLNAPTTTPPVYVSSLNEASSSSSSSHIRPDPSLPRSYFVQTGLVSQASGSAYLECDDTIKVACAVYGPRQARNSRNFTEEAELNVDVRFASFATKRRKKSGKDTESASVGDAVRLALLPSLRLDLLPKASIDVFITILEVGASRGGAVEGDGDDDEDYNDDEAAAAAATTIASCALADAGIEMWGLVVGLNGVVVKTPPKSEKMATILVDPSISEMHSIKPKAKRASAMTLYTMPALGTVTSIQQGGDSSLDEIDSLMDALQTASHSIHYTIAKALKDGYLARERRSGKGIITTQ